MPVLRLVDNIAAGLSDPNIVAGERFEFLPRAALVKVYAINPNGVEGDMAMTISLSNAIVADNVGIPVAPTGPNRNEHLLSSEFGAAGDRLIISVNNSSGGQLTVITLIELTFG